MSQAPDGRPEGTQVRRRRAPRYRAFMITGAAVGLVLALLATVLGGDTGEYSRSSLLGYLSVALGVLGAMLGGLIAIVLERRSSR